MVLLVLMVVRRRAARRGARVPRSAAGLVRRPRRRRARGSRDVGWFAVIHFRPVEYPGLFVFGLVPAPAALTGRLGMLDPDPAAFNVTGLLLALR